MAHTLQAGNRVWWPLARLLSSLVAGCVLALSSESSALDLYCSDFRPLLADDELERPDPPNCLDSLAYATESFEFEACSQALGRYESEIRDYLRCLEDEADQAVEQHNRLVERFNCYVGGSSFCP